MAWIIFQGKPKEVDVIKRPVTIVEVYAKAKDGTFSIPVLDEEIYETLDDLKNGLTLNTLKPPQHI